MVTLRRDVAVQNNNRVFDRAENLTNYDMFMREKRMSEVNRSSSACAQAISRSSFDLSDYTYFSAPQVTVVEPKIEVNDSYDDYMRSQLHRASGEERILSEDEYYQARYAESVGQESVKATKASKKAKRSLTKFGKIFLGAYVILTVAVASTILAVNLGNGESVKTKASAGANDGISALAMEFEEEEGNWFDDMCDAVSNK
ncbi:MAG: hypothetical protein J6R44_05275 [Clostridia bacterium]|nr:hypothetical protein [Clostridia bacterium]MBO7177516.1 hypothetical protein [Clostridia bacterium]